MQTLERTQKPEADRIKTVRFAREALCFNFGRDGLSSATSGYGRCRIWWRFAGKVIATRTVYDRVIIQYMLFVSRLCAHAGGSRCSRRTVSNTGSMLLNGRTNCTLLRLITHTHTRSVRTIWGSFGWAGLEGTGCDCGSPDCG